MTLVKKKSIRLRCRPKASFTLFELVMVAVIVILMAFIMVPYIAQNHEAGSHRRDFSKLWAWAQWAQSQAITEQRPYQIVFNAPQKKYTIQRYAGGAFSDIETVYLEPSSSLVIYDDGILRFNHFGVNVNPSGVPVANESFSVVNREWLTASLRVGSVNGRMTCLQDPD